MRDLNSRTFDRTGRRRPNSSTVRLLCPKAQRTLAWRSCWFRHPMWCRRRRPRKSPRGLERVPGTRRCRIHHPTVPRRIPPVKTRRKKKRPLLLQRGERRKGRPPSLGREEKEGRPLWGGRRVQEGENPSSGLLHRRRRWRRGVAAQGQAPGKIVSIRIPE